MPNINLNWPNTMEKRNMTKKTIKNTLIRALTQTVKILMDKDISKILRDNQQSK
jgi:AAA+ superfamily predicted ATPase